MDEIVNKYTSVTRTNTATAGEDFLSADFETALEHGTPENFIDVKEDGQGVRCPMPNLIGSTLSAVVPRDDPEIVLEEEEEEGKEDDPRVVKSDKALASCSPIKMPPV